MITSDDTNGHSPSWHTLAVEDVMRRLGSSKRGLSAGDAAARLAEHGPNEIEDKGSKKPLIILWAQLTAVMVVILIGAALLSLALGKLLEASAIGAIVVLFALLGFFQEYRAEKAIAALRKLAVPSVRAVRNGRTVEFPAAELVPGDLVQLDAGSVVPADMRLVEAANLRIQEATLTGESEPVDKHVDPLDRSDLALGDRRNMGYSGTQVTYGRGVGVVTSTGMGTELGRIATLLQEVKADRTPLQHKLDRVGKQLALVGLVVAVLTVIMGAIAGESGSDLVLTAISVAVAVIPEGLPAVVTFTLAIGAQRMLRRNSLIRKLPAVETLGSVTTICSDKTGTLTQNRMTVTVIDIAHHRFDLTNVHPIEATESGPSALRLALAAGVLCNDGDLRHEEDGTPTTIGDPTETALLQVAHEAGLDIAAIRRLMPRIAENPFDSDRKRMSTLHGPIDGRVEALAGLPQDTPIAFLKGAIDGLLASSTHIWADEGAVELTDEWRERVLGANDSMASNGMRVLAIAYRTVDGAHEAHVAEQELTLLCLVGIIDPPRAEVRDAVATCRSAGIRPVMITGDHPLTAKAIATDLGITTTDRVLTGGDLDRLSEAEFEAAVSEVSVFARVSPEHKLRIVELLQKQGQVVAMTGDGVNDAPALKRADIGVAMGITGTDVSKEASDMVLRDDNFATIVAAVEEGRVIYDNLRRFVSFAVAGNLGKIIVMLGWPIPYLIGGGDIKEAVALLPLQLLWLNLMTDGLLGLSMGVEPAEKKVMQRQPRRPESSIWSDGLGPRTAWVGVLIGVIALAIGFAYHETDHPEWQTMLFTSLAFLQVFQAIGTRSYRESISTIGWTSNRLMVAIAGAVVALQLLAVYSPLNEFLDLEPLGAWDLLLCIGSGAALLVTLETVKAFHRRKAEQA